MDIVVLESSPHKNGASNTLADYFIKGARETGHTVHVLDVAHMDIKPCVGCYAGKLRNLYNGMAEYLRYENLGTVMAKGCGSPETIHGSRYAEEAYRLGKALKQEN